MALPVTITGISTAVACAGPFQSSGGNYYFFGASTTAGRVQAQKATDPTSAFSQIGTDQQPNSATAINALSAFQVGDVIHVGVSLTNTNTIAYQYLTFDMATDAWVLTENITASLTTTGQTGSLQSACSIIVRSGGEVVTFFNGAQTKTGGTQRARVYYSRRTAVNTWSAATEVDASAAADSITPEAILGASDRIHFYWAENAVGAANKYRSLSSANVLDTQASNGVGGNNSGPGVSYGNAGVIKVVHAVANTVTYYDSGANPTINTVSGTAPVANFTTPGAVFNDVTDVWALYRKAVDSDLYVAKSTDDGATWSGETVAFSGITVASLATNLSVDGIIYTRGSSVVIPYIVNDNGTLKYNEYIVRTIASSDVLIGNQTLVMM